MPGSSLWLLPPPNHPLNAHLFTLIQETSSHFDSEHLFLPHITLTSGIDPAVYGGKPQSWLDSLDLPKASNVHVQFGALNSEDVFFRKLYIQIDKEGVTGLGKVSRRVVKGFEEDEVAGKWSEEVWVPHLSLLYHDCPVIQGEEREEIQKLTSENGIELDGSDGHTGWEGGRIVLVPTDRPIKDWEPIAERVL